MAAVGPRHKVSTAPARVVVVEVNQSLCGVSVIAGGDYGAWRECNLRRCQDDARKARAEPAAACTGSEGNGEAGASDAEAEEGEAAGEADVE